MNKDGRQQKGPSAALHNLPVEFLLDSEVSTSRFRTLSATLLNSGAFSSQAVCIKSRVSLLVSMSHCAGGSIEMSLSGSIQM